MLLDFSDTTVLVPLPCGCVVNASDTEVFTEDGVEYAVCMWCDTTFNKLELKEGINGGAAPMIIITAQPPTLVCVNGERVLEAQGRCTCGAPQANEIGKRRKLFHLDEAEIDSVKVLRN